MATNTYVPIDTYTVSGSSTTQVIFGAGGTLPQIYTDLIIVANMKNNTGANYNLQMQVGNGSVDTSNYSSLYFGSSGNGSTYAGVDTVLGGYRLGLTSNSNFTPVIIHLQNYANTSTSKSYISRGSDAGGNVIECYGFWNSTSAINIIRLYNEAGAVFGAGSTFSLYGIANAQIGAPKATGGIITYDNTYYYHTFGSSGTFTPQQSLTADVLLVAGGGGSGRNNMTNNNSGAGAGGYRLLTNNSLTTTAYTITVGAGGTAGASDGADGTKGGNSSIAGSGFTTLTSTGGGLAATTGVGGTGGSGAGGSSYNNNAGGAGNQGSYSPVEGYAGGSGSDGTNYPAGGGGGAGGAGGSGSSGSAGGAGGIGSATASSWGLVTGTGQNVSGIVYYAGGGGGGAAVTGGAGGYGGGGAGSSNLATNNGLANTGGGAGGSGGAPGQKNGANGGSGIVIVRYLK